MAEPPLQNKAGNVADAALDAGNAVEGFAGNISTPESADRYSKLHLIKLLSYMQFHLTSAASERNAAIARLDNELWGVVRRRTTACSRVLRRVAELARQQG